MFLSSLVVVLLSTAVVFGNTLPETFLHGNGRIVGGNYSEARQFPYMASLRSMNTHFCGAAILHERWVMTAAHCLIDRQSGGFVVTVGSHTLNRGDQHRVALIVMHPLFDTNVSMGNDIALIQTASLMVFSIVSRPIELPKEDAYVTDDAIVAGWGHSTEEGGFTNTLKWKTTKIITLDECREQFSEEHAPLVTDKNICTANEEDRAVCYGDSGGPLVSKGVAVGIVSWSVGCNSLTPDVYVRVWPYLQWILDTIES